jgi:hypothetical protein
MDTKIGRRIGGIVLAAIIVASIFSAFFTPASALAYTAEKITLTGSGGTPDSSMKYDPGDTVYYRVRWTPTSEAVTITHTYDQFADGTTQDYITTDTAWAQNALYEVFPTWVVPLNWSSDHFANNFVVQGRDSAGSNFTATIPFTSYMKEHPPEVDFDWNGTDCLEVTFNAWVINDSIINWTWDFGAGASPGSDSGTGAFVPEPVTYGSCVGSKTVKLTACNADGCYTKTHTVTVVCGPQNPIISMSPDCYEVNGTEITFDVSVTGGSLPLSYKWEVGGTNYTNKTIKVMVTADVTAKVTVTDALNCSISKEEPVKACSGCSLRLYGTFDNGAGDLSVPCENKPYTDPVAPFYPQSEQAPRKDFITFDPAFMDQNDHECDDYGGLKFYYCVGDEVNKAKEKVFKRMWYEKEWFKDHHNNNEFDVVQTDGQVVTLDWWNKQDLTYKKNHPLREWNSEAAPWYKGTADVYGPAIIQEFTYMFLNEDTDPIMVKAGSSVLVPMAHDPANKYRGLNSFDMNGDHKNDFVTVESEKTLWMDIDGDGTKEYMETDGTPLSGDETVVLLSPAFTLGVGEELQFFDHKVVFDGKVQVENGDFGAEFDVFENTPGGHSQENVDIEVGDYETFSRGQVAHHGGEFFIKVNSVGVTKDEVTIQVGRMFGQTFMNVGSGSIYLEQKAFVVDGVLYNVVAIHTGPTANSNCIKYITFRQKVPKVPIKYFDLELEWYAPLEGPLPEMPPFNLPHKIMEDVRTQDEWSSEPGPEDKVPEHPSLTCKAPLAIDYIIEGVEERYRGELKEIYNETNSTQRWVLEWFWTKPWQFTEFRLHNKDLYCLVTLSWRAPEAEGVLWDHGTPEIQLSDGRFKFWYKDCTGPIYVDNYTLRLYGTFGEGAGNLNVPCENKPYTDDPVGPFYPQSEQAPKKDFVTFNPAAIDHNDPDFDYSMLSYKYCDGTTVNKAQEKVFKRMWYEKEWFKDHVNNNKWDIVTTKGVMTLDQWKAMPVQDRPTIIEVNCGDAKLGPWNPAADVYAPAILQEFTYMFLNENTEPIMVNAGSRVLIPMASQVDDGNGIDSFDAFLPDGITRDYVRVESEKTLWMDIDGDGTKEYMETDGKPLSGDETVVLVLPTKTLASGQELEFFDHKVMFTSVVQMAGGDPGASFYVSENTPGGHDSNVNIEVGKYETFSRGQQTKPGGEFYIKVISVSGSKDQDVRSDLYERGIRVYLP